MSNDLCFVWLRLNNSNKKQWKFESITTTIKKKKEEKKRKEEWIENNSRQASSFHLFMELLLNASIVCEREREIDRETVLLFQHSHSIQKLILRAHMLSFTFKNISTRWEILNKKLRTLSLYDVNCEAVANVVTSIFVYIDSGNSIIRTWLFPGFYGGCRRVYRNL